MQRFVLSVAVLVMFNVLNVLMFFHFWYVGAWFVAPIVFGGAAALCAKWIFAGRGFPVPLVVILTVMLAGAAGLIAPRLCIRARWMPVPFVIGLFVGALVEYIDRRFEKPQAPRTRELKPRRFQFGLRTLLLAPVVLATALGWLVLPLNQARRNSRAIAAIRELGFVPLYEPHEYLYRDMIGMRQGDFVPRSYRADRPIWLSYFGDEYFGDIIGVRVGFHPFRMRKFGDADLVHLKDVNELMNLRVLAVESGGWGTVTDAGLEHLRGLTNLEKLFLNHSQVSGPGLAHVKGLAKLEYLDLDWTPMTDGGLEHLKGLRNLEVLRLNNTKVGDAGLEHLKGLTSLQWLDLYGTQVTDSGLEHLKGLTSLWKVVLIDTEVSGPGLEHLRGLTNLQGLYLGGTPITDAGLEHLKGLTNLRRLSLKRTRITDPGLEHLKGLTTLRWLDLSGTQVTGSGLEHLKGLTSLVQLDLSGTQVTDAGVKNLQEALPNVRISH